MQFFSYTRTVCLDLAISCTCIFVTVGCSGKPATGTMAKPLDPEVEAGMLRATAEYMKTHGSAASKKGPRMSSVVKRGPARPHR